MLFCFHFTSKVNNTKAEVQGSTPDFLRGQWKPLLPPVVAGWQPCPRQCGGVGREVLGFPGPSFTPAAA